MELPHDLFEVCLSPTDSSTPVRFQAAITKAAGSLHVEACQPIDVEEYEELGHCKRELVRVPAPVTVSAWGGPDEDRVVTGLEQGAWRVEWRGETLHVLATSSSTSRVSPTIRAMGSSSSTEAAGSAATSCGSRPRRPRSTN